MKLVAIAFIALALLLPTRAMAQESPIQYGARLPTIDGACLSPVASNQLWSDEKDHLGRGSVDAWDWASSIGSPVFAMCDGVVEYAGCNDAGHYGCWLYIRYANFKAVHAHCKEGSITVSNGDSVNAWTQICVIGMTGWTDGPHTHLEIHKMGGGRYKINQFFDLSLMHYCKFCDSTNDPNASIAKAPMTQAQSADFYTAEPHENQGVFIWQLWAEQIKTAPPNVLGGAIVAMALLLFVLKDRWRNAVVSLLVVVIAFVVVAEVPVANLKVAQAQETTQETTQEVPQDRAFDIAYTFAMRWEGHQCTNDGAYTMAGVTQGAYNAYRSRHGLPQADVCQSLTEEERKAIAYEDYWLKSGADKLPFPINVAHFDFSFNAGAGDGGAPKNILAQCGVDVGCYNNARAAWYKTRKSCSLYCGGWLRRVADIVKITE